MTVAIFTNPNFPVEKMHLLTLTIASYIRSDEVIKKFKSANLPDEHVGMLANFILCFIPHLNSLTHKVMVATKLHHAPTAASARLDIEYLRNMAGWVYETVTLVGLNTEGLGIHNSPEPFLGRMGELMAELDEAFPADVLVA